MTNHQLDPSQMEESERAFEFGPDAHNPGFYEQAYPDPLGIPTIGIGHNLPGNPQSDIENLTGHPNYNDVLNGRQSLTEAQTVELYNIDMNRAIDNARALIPNFDQLPESVQQAVADMSFNLGPAGLAGFHNMIDALNNGNLDAARQAMQDSSWYNQVGQRAAADYVLMMLPDLFESIQQTIEEVISHSPDFQELINWSSPENALQPSEPGDYSTKSSDYAVAVNEAGAGESPVTGSDWQSGAGNRGFAEDPGWDGGELGDPTSYPGSSGDGYAGGGSGEGSGGPGAYGEGGSWGGGQAGTGESGGQFGGGEGGYSGEGGFGGYGGESGGD